MFLGFMGSTIDEITGMF